MTSARVPHEPALPAGFQSPRQDALQQYGIIWPLHLDLGKILKEAALYLGTQNPPRNDEERRQLAQLGVRHVCFDPPGNPHDWSMDDLKRHRDRVDSCGLQLDMVQLPLSSRPIEEQLSPDILSAGPNRDRQIRFDLRPDRKATGGRDPGCEIQSEHHRYPPHRAGGRPRRVTEHILSVGQG